MKLANLLAPCSVVLAVFVAACANDGDVEIAPTNNGVDAGTRADAAPKADAGTTQDAAPKVCISSCNIDQDCQNTCPPLNTGIQCCDTQTHTCFASQTASCPVTEQDSGTPPPY